MPQIRKFSIKNLHGKKRDVEIFFDNNTLILVGENGSGKTTILHCFFYFISKQWSQLIQYRFDEISIDIDGEEFSIKKPSIESFISKRRRVHRIPTFIANELEDIILTLDYPFKSEYIEKIADRYDIPPHYILEHLNYFGFHRDKKKTDEKLRKLSLFLSESIDFQIIYLPTYRRIEQELTSIFKWMDDSTLRKKATCDSKSQNTYVELIEFGMQDVKESIDNTIKNLNNTARLELNNLTSTYLADIIDEKYSMVDANSIRNIDENVIDNAINRIHENILSSANKSHLRITIDKVKKSQNITEHEKIICHYFTKLMSFQQSLQEKEKNINTFCDVCNDYLVNKLFVYDSGKFALNVFDISTRKDKRRINPLKIKDEYIIKLQNLSSGEKQIVSLFSHLYLSGKDKYFVVIDEPELSLSVPWQKRFLADIHKSEFCSGVFAVTHSPFIFDNELKKYAHGINEFVVQR